MSAVPPEARQPTEGGLLNHRCEFAREDPDNRGEPPENPEWLLFSDNMISIFNWSPEGNLEAKRGVGSADAESFWPGPEEHEATFEYHLQRWFIDENGDPLDAMYDGLFRDADNRLPNSQTIVDRETHHSGGSMGAGFYSYTVGLGGKIDTVSNDGDAEENMPIPFEVEYQFEKVRPYIVNRLDEAATLVIESTSEEDTDVEITIESEGAGESETVTLNGTTPVATTTAFESVDAVWLTSDTQGNVTVSKDVGDGGEGGPEAGPLVIPIYGRETHNNIEGDRGIPLLGTGTREEEIQPEDERFYEHFLSSRLDRAPTVNLHGLEFGPRLNSASFEVNNNIDVEALAHTRRQALDEGIREVEVEASIAGPMASHKSIMDHLISDGADVTWQFLGGTLRFPDAHVTDPGERAPEAEEVMKFIDVSLMSRQSGGDPSIVIT